MGKAKKAQVFVSEAREILNIDDGHAGAQAMVLVL